MTLAKKITDFYFNLKFDVDLPKGIEVMNPFEDILVADLASRFYEKYYSDNRNRKLILGINPGRLGGGVTGIPFTDPVKMEKNCGINNDLNKVTEPSAGFIYDMIQSYGGTRKFYDDYFIYAVCPLGFTKNGLNYNYYDSKTLEKAVTPFIVESLKKILQLEIETNTCYCLGNGKNYQYLAALNKDHRFFKNIFPLPHPRWIVQYKRKHYHYYLMEYLEKLK